MPHSRGSSPTGAAPDRIVIDCPTHLDPLVAVSVRGIFANEEEFGVFDKRQGQLQFAAIFANVAGPVTTLEESR